jgi:hypothetical protein
MFGTIAVLMSWIVLTPAERALVRRGLAKTLTVVP